ncbi:MAG: hypothetical protein AAGA17_04940 [Actinomycetota bacterium]
MQHITTRPLRLIALILTPFALLAACGGDSASGGDDSLVEYFVSQDAPREEAECVAAELSEFDDAEVIAAFEADEPPADAEELVDALIGAFLSCELE